MRVSKPLTGSAPPRDFDVGHATVCSSRGGTLIGISEYPPGIPALGGVANDVREIAKVLRSNAAAVSQETRSRNSSTAAQWRTAIREAIKTIFESRSPRMRRFLCI